MLHEADGTLALIGSDEVHAAKLTHERVRTFVHVLTAEDSQAVIASSIIETKLRQGCGFEIR